MAQRRPPRRQGRKPNRPDPRTRDPNQSERRKPSAPHVNIDLPEGWFGELRNTVRAHRLQKVAEEIDEALAAYQSDDYERAASLAERAKNEAPRSGRIRELLGLSYYRAGRWHDGLRELLTYRRLTGRKDQNHVIADCYRADGKPDKALHIVNEVTPEDVPPDIWSELMIVAASTMAETGDISRALAQLSRAELKPKKVEPHHLRLWYVRADLLEKAGRDHEARSAWEAIAAEDPTFFDVAERLAGAT